MKLIVDTIVNPTSGVITRGSTHTYGLPGPSSAVSIFLQYPPSDRHGLPRLLLPKV